jgi:hypothetical protein
MMGRECRLRRRPRTAAADHDQLEARQRLSHLCEPSCRHADFEIIVLAGLLSEEEVECPSGRDVPRHREAFEMACSLDRAPGVPRGEIEIERLGRLVRHKLRSSGASGRSRAE